MSTYFNHLREIAASEIPHFDELSHLSRAVAYANFLADNPDYFDDILVEPSNYLSSFRENLLTILMSWDIHPTVLDPEIIIHLQAEFFVICENALMNRVAEDYEKIRQNETYCRET